MISPLTISPSKNQRVKPESVYVVAKKNGGRIKVMAASVIITLSIYYPPSTSDLTYYDPDHRVAARARKSR